MIADISRLRLYLKGLLEGPTIHMTSNFDLSYNEYSSC